MAGRLKAAFVSGTILNNPLAIGDTTLSSAGLSTFPTVASPDIGVIVLDPTGSAGAPEVVWVTTHTAAATTATIARAKEGTSARQHAVSVAWVHGPTIMDMTQRQGTDLATAATLTLPDTDEDTFALTGTTGITAISARAAGKIIQLYPKTSSDSPIYLTSGASLLTNPTVNISSGVVFSTSDFQLLFGDISRWLSLGAGVWKRIFDQPVFAQVTGGSVTLTNANTYYDGASISCGPGVWLFGCSAHFGTADSNSVILSLNINGSEVHYEFQNVYVANAAITFIWVAVLSTTQTVKLQGKCSAAGKSMDANYLSAVRIQ